jgi:hypothetical protein
MISTPTPPNNLFNALRRFAKQKEQRQEICELCSVPIVSDHQHLVEPANRKLVCACDACAILFSSQDGGKYRRVPRTIRFLRDFQLTDAQWDQLMVPINMAFFFYSTPAGKTVALYPSPAGATESLLTLECWEEIKRDNSVLCELQPDVEALLVNRGARTHGQSAPEYFIVPIDDCYKLVGLIRAYWRGLSGGTRVWEEISRFFSDLKDRSTSSQPETTRA